MLRYVSRLRESPEVTSEEASDVLLAFAASVGRVEGQVVLGWQEQVEYGLYLAVRGAGRIVSGIAAIYAHDGSPHSRCGLPEA